MTSEPTRDYGAPWLPVTDHSTPVPAPAAAYDWHPGDCLCSECTSTYEYWLDEE